MVDWKSYSYRELRGHTKSVRCLKMTKSKLVSGSNDNTVRVWDINSKSSSYVSLEGHSGGITGVDLEDGYVVSGSWDGSIRLWEPARTNKSLKILSGHNGPVLSVQLKESVLASCSVDKTLKLWRLHKNAAISETLEGHNELISCMQFSDSNLVSGSYDCNAKIWDIPKAYCISTLTGHTGPIHSLQISGSLMVTGSFDKSVKIWDLLSGACVHTMRENSLIWKVCLAEQYLACGTLAGGLCMWDMRNCSPSFQTTGHDGCVKDLAFSNGICSCCPYNANMPSQHIVSGSSDSTVKVWCVEHTTDCAKVMRTHNGEVMCVDADENKVASGGVDGKVCLCNSPPKTPQKSSIDTYVEPNCLNCNKPNTRHDEHAKHTKTDKQPYLT